ncbi:MAG: alpha/beta hydrolase fold domain-containing protein [Euryarchaeota archaeon]|nr:alpha/beta hydrolase fold domain-containing protein [Euryarchaeota archaeon]
MKNLNKSIFTILIISNLCICLLPVQADKTQSVQILSADNATPPGQPKIGPGSSNYSHTVIKRSRYGLGGQEYWIFEPENPTPQTAPLIVFNHGWSAMYPFFYQEWINHLVKRGNIVVYPRYQLTLTIDFRAFNSNAITAVKKAITELQNGNHVKPDLTKFAIVGHSLGGGITANMAALAEQEGLPIPKAIMPVQPAIAYTPEKVNFSTISNHTLMLVIVGENDTVVGNESGKTIFYGANNIPLTQKDFVIQVTDAYGSPTLIADHLAPLAFRNNIGGTVNAMDYYSTWKLFDALTDYAFFGTNEEYCLGNTSEQRFMGLWSDDTLVKEMIVTDTP